MKRWILLLIVLFVVGCQPAELETAPPLPDPVEPAPEPVVEPVKPEPVEEPVEPAPKVEEPEEEPVHDNKLKEGYVDLENFKGSTEDILFSYLDKLDDEQFKQTQQRRYMKIDKKYEGEVDIYYPKWIETTDEFLTREARMIGNVWEQANAGKSQYFKGTLHDYKGRIVAKVVVKKGEVKATLVTY